MEALSAFISIISIVAIVLVVGGLVAFIGHMIIGAFDTTSRATNTKEKDVIDYSQYKELNNLKSNDVEQEYDFEAINRSKAKQEKEMLNKEDFSIYDLGDDQDDELEEIEKRLTQESKLNQKVQDQDEIGELDFDDMLDEISSEIIDKEHAKTEEVKVGDALAGYSIDKALREAEDVSEETEEFDEKDEEITSLREELAQLNKQIEEDNVKRAEEIAEAKDAEINSLKEQLESLNKKVEEESIRKAQQDAEMQSAQMNIFMQQFEELKKQLEEVKKEKQRPYMPMNFLTYSQPAQTVQTEEGEVKNEEKEIIIEPDAEVYEEENEDFEEEIFAEEAFEETQETVAINDNSVEVEELKAKLEELNRQLEEARSTKVEVVSIDMTEDECVERLQVLEERLKNVKKDYKINMKEYRPLKKVMTDLEKYQTKLRRKEAIVAKKKVALYGVNNYVDIDKEKAEKLANELELLDGLRLSVSHCEEVINANKDRFPILEHSNQILESQIASLESDIISTQETLQKIRDKKGNGESSNN